MQGFRLMHGIIIICLVLIGSAFSEAQVKFTDVTAEMKADNDGRAITLSFNDYNGDGRPDILIGNGDKSCSLLRSDGNVFTDVTKDAGILNDELGTKTWIGSSVISGDYDNDGDLDIFVATDAWPPDPSFESCRNYLYQNNGDGTFIDVTLTAGVSGLETGSFGAVFADYDSDGLLDLYVVNLGSPNTLYKNKGDGSFNDVTEEVGVHAGMDAQGAGVGAIFFDAENDGDLDLYAINGYGLPGFFYANNGDGTFKDRSQKSGLAEPGDPINSALGDYDNDGDLDIYVANYLKPNVLYNNKGDGTFTNVASEAGVDINEYTKTSPFFDYDNDGYLDLLVVIKGQGMLFYKNMGDGKFQDIAKKVGLTEGMAVSVVSTADYDLDGDQDIYLANNGSDKVEPNVLYRNDGGNSGNWLQVFVKSKHHVDGIGAQVKVTAGEITRVAQVAGGYGIYQDWLGTHFGLGENGWADKVEVRFPDGTVVATEELIKANQALVVNEDGFKEFAISKSVTPGEKKLVTLAEVKRYVLLQNYPNPFNPETWMPFILGDDADIMITVYNAAGKVVRRLELSDMKAGSYVSKDRAAYWDGRDMHGDKVASGLYLYTIKAGDFQATKRMILVK